MMKSLITFAAIILMVSCKNEGSTATSVENVYVDSFFEDVKNLDSETIKTPIKSFLAEAEELADKKIDLTKDNTKDAFKTALDYTKAVIVVENHTIVKILSQDDCKPSGAWATCMPLVEGYIKKGDLDYKKDYANNIIGIPDNQKRTLYLFE